MKIDFVTLFPDWVLSTLTHSMMARAERAGVVTFGTCNPRDFCTDPHRKVDDTPYGGHPGMLMMPEPVALAIEQLATPGCAIVFTEPSGIPFSQAQARNLTNFEHIVFVCGHYEGIDHRVEEMFATHVFSVGDYVLTNGELPALTMTDSIVRLLDGVLGSPESLAEDSFCGAGLSAPNYTRPEVWRGRPIPSVLKSGHHAEIAKWRQEQAAKRTADRRPDLLKGS